MGPTNHCPSPKVWYFNPVAFYHAEYKPFLPYSDLHGKYTPVYLIAVGGMSEIWACLNHQAGELVAVKRLLPHSMTEITNRKSGLWEELALRSIDHPNVLRFIEKGLDDGRLCFVTELIAGINFDHYLSRHPLTVELFLELGLQMLEGTSAIHAAHLVHGDLKPENMMLTQELHGLRTLKILDFGTAALLRPLMDLKESTYDPSELLVTAEYAAPELLTGSPPSVASDLYALGMSFYHCLAGSPPFEAPQSREILRMQIHEQPRDLREIRGDLPAYLCHWIMKFLSKDPARRPSSAAESLDELRTMKRQHPMVKKLTRRTGTRRVSMHS
jgi:eukaryotic-like serine/threonine-protein kinase